MDAEMSWNFQYHARGLNCLLLYTAVPMRSMTMTCETDNVHVIESISWPE